MDLGRSERQGEGKKGGVGEGRGVGRGRERMLQTSFLLLSILFWVGGGGWWNWK